MNILLLEPFYSGSHQSWAEGLIRHSVHEIALLSLPGRWWKWRMHGGAVTLARMAHAWVSQHGRPDLLLVTDMLDLTTFLALTGRWSAELPVALYMHENQLTYPLPADPQNGPMRRQQGERDLHYAFINYTAMLAADAVLFNSRFHQDSWFDALPGLLKHFPDYNELDTIAQLQAKTSVLPLGLDLRRLDASRAIAQRLPAGGPPIILWNHRWEYDKDPAAFFDALYTLVDEGIDFRLVVCGENFRRVPAEFDRARAQLSDRIMQWGRVKAAQYGRWLWAADIVVSTAWHDYFGAAVVEAIYCGCRPVLPQRLAYLEHIPPTLWPETLYTGPDQFLTLLKRAIDQPKLDLQSAVKRYDWQTMAPIYDQKLGAIDKTHML